MLFLKEHLTGHYSWNDTIEQSNYTGGASRRLFDRFNGYQVLFIINLYKSLSETFSIEDGQQVEQQIIDHLPLGIKSEISVFNWLRGIS
jgi:hypothetical protein